MNFNDNEVSLFIGKKITLEVFGASHAEKIGVKVSGLNGNSFDEKALESFLERRKAVNASYSTKRLEPDKVEFDDNVSDGKIAGDFTAVIRNTAQRSSDYFKTEKIPRPSHADYVAWQKYGDGYDYRGGGKFSGRLTAPICVAGGIIKQLLEKKGINVCAFITRIGGVKGKSYKDLPADMGKISFEDEKFPLLDEVVGAKMREEIESARRDGDSVGGEIGCVITGVPVGKGEYMFDSIEGVISRLAFAVPAVKGIEFGSGFGLAAMRGSKANDPFYYSSGRVVTGTNNNGGINGGISNGMPITFGVAIKPTPSIAKEQDTVNLTNGKNVKLKIEGRHDACIVPRAVPVIEAIAAIAVYDII